LRDEIKSQRVRDKQSFSGLFDRGEVYDNKDLQEEKETRQKSKVKEAIESNHRDIILGKQLAQMYDERGMEIEKVRVEQSLQREICARDEYTDLNNVNFREPTEKMVRDAKSMGVDLSDPQTAEMLEQMQKASMSGTWLDDIDTVVFEKNHNNIVSRFARFVKFRLQTNFATVRGLFLICFVAFVVNRIVSTLDLNREFFSDDELTLAATSYPFAIAVFLLSSSYHGVVIRIYSYIIADLCEKKIDNCTAGKVLAVSSYHVFVSLSQKILSPLPFASLHLFLALTLNIHCSVSPFIFAFVHYSIASRFSASSVVLRHYDQSMLRLFISLAYRPLLRRTSYHQLSSCVIAFVASNVQSAFLNLPSLHHSRIHLSSSKNQPHS
jgi:hypothetical protein